MREDPGAVVGGMTTPPAIAPEAPMPGRPQQGSAPPNWLTRSQVAARLGVSKTSIRRMESAGELTCTRDGSGNWRFDPARVEALAAARAAGIGSPPAATLSSPAAAVPEAAPIGPRTGMTPSTGRAAPLAPDVDARVFDALAAGASVRDCVRELRLPAPVVEASWRAWNRLTALEFSSESPPASIGERLDNLEAALSEQRMALGWLVERVARFERALILAGFGEALEAAHEQHQHFGPT